MFGTFEQGQRVFPIQQWRFGLFNFSPDIPAVNIFEKVGVNYVGPLVIYKIVYPHNYLLMDIEGQLMRWLFEHERLKPAILHMDNGNVRTLWELKRVMNLGLTIQNGPS